MSEEFQKFLEDTKEKFDKYFGDLGYACFMFNKTTSGESVFITNSPEKVLTVVEPYANAPKVAERKANKGELKKLRRVK